MIFCCCYHYNPALAGGKKYSKKSEAEKPSQVETKAKKTAVAAQPEISQPNAKDDPMTAFIKFNVAKVTGGRGGGEVLECGS